MGVVSQVAPETIGSLLHSCSITKAFRHGLSYHAAVLKSGLQADTIISNHILNLYAKCGKITLARKVFDEMPERNLVSWSAMVSGYDQAHEPRMAIELFSKMGLVPNEYVLASAVSACASLLALSQGQQIHAQSVKLGYSSISFVSNSLITMYMKCGRPCNALSVFSSMFEPNSVSYNALIAGLVENEKAERGFEVFKQMCRQGLLLDRCTFVGLLSFCSTADNLRRGMVLHCLTIKLKLDSTPFIGNVIITMYSKFNMIEEAEKAFRLIVEKDVISWNTIIAACCRSDDHAKGLSIFKEMENKVSLSPDDFTFASALAACAGFASIRHGEQIHAHLIRTKLDDDVGVDNALVNMYAKCGCLGYAYTVFNQMGCQNLVSWNSIIAGFGNHGHGAKAMELFERMKEIGLKPDSITFVALLTACNHAGLVDEGQAYFNSMNVIYGIAPGIEHFSCLIDLLGRAGRLNEAEEYMEKFPFGHDQVVLGSLLSACRVHGDVIIGERLARKLLNFHPVTTSPYVLLSNLYASDGMWNCAAEARKMLKGSGLKKEPGHSLIEVEGGVEKFTIGDFSHSRIEDIVHILKTLSWERDEVFSYYS
ncbi:pentatricopeptide repeat-containing protein At2g13600-like [Actinidia eriantha]|uniref:pentatricopeptide repeat-containing protein At2g13600-like n=1 Tax=Actinidia eriantha TaxID=165200 RepID=UPI00258D731E|nr:pentatricopeptide repeat-containing protein At2g13600-like [Actinidia eriantha]XP_057499256.1 pentatricopeptide repeat-containing protein At2g13600-like [Actinidia eriantha]XP_057499257.1 pentatricopeptide repeat-containing protein At2g13600-like [Actinidia eriantha]XP_057499258.1 pentatricopeptide repeat-containing protein At2g13600-like [Actinidia eriantha]XP_057499259.1 pentatricopeptide repeat-containing protein At2g13600-like [Actinidia eriantha]XP_057499260.1 pentatricopeptide repeat-